MCAEEGLSSQTYALLRIAEINVRVYVLYIIIKIVISLNS